MADYTLIQNEFLSVLAAVYHHANNTAQIGATVQCDSMRLLSGDKSFGAAGHVSPVLALDLDKACTISNWDKKTRSGTLTARFSAPFSQPGAVISVRMSGYNVNGVGFSCDSIVLKSVADTHDSTSFDVHIYNGVAAGDEFTIRYHISGRMVAYPASGTAAIRNTLRFSGSGSGTNRSGKSFSARVAGDLPEEKVRSCKYISKGRTEIVPAGFKARIVNYGDGTCNDDAAFEVNGNTIAFKLK